MLSFTPAGRALVGKWGGGSYLAPVALQHRIGTFNYRLVGGVWQIDTDPYNFAPVAARDPLGTAGKKIYYVHPVTGNDAAAGTQVAPLQRVSAAAAKSDVDVIVCPGGYVYGVDGGGTPPRTKGLGTYIGNRDLCIVATGASPAIFTTARETTWTAHATLPNVYTSAAVGGAIALVLDTARKDVNGDYLRMAKVASEVDCGSTPNSFYPTGTVVHVNLGGGVPGATTLALRASGNGLSAPGTKVYYKNIEFLGNDAVRGFSLNGGNISSVGFFEDCKFAGAFSSDSVAILDYGLAIFKNSRASAGPNDCFNYTAANGLSPHGWEIGTVAIGAQHPGDGQGSTSHDDCRVIRQNPSYSVNAGPGFADIATAKSLNLGVQSFGNTGHAMAGGALIRDNAEVWIRGGNFHDNQGPDVDIADSVKLHIADLVMDDASVTISGGTPTIDANFG